jgi:hypothetical protein
MVRGRKKVNIFGHEAEAPLDLDLTPRMGQKTGPQMRGIPQPDIRSGPVDSFDGVRGLGTKDVLLAQARERDAAAVRGLQQVNPRAALSLINAQAKNRIMSGATGMAFKESLAGKRVRGGESVEGSDQLRGLRDHIPDPHRGKAQVALMGLMQEKGFEDMEDFIKRKQLGVDANTFIRNFRGR